MDHSFAGCHAFSHDSRQRCPSAMPPSQTGSIQTIPTNHFIPALHCSACSGPLSDPPVYCSGPHSLICHNAAMMRPVLFWTACSVVSLTSNVASCSFLPRKVVFSLFLLLTICLYSKLKILTIYCHVFNIRLVSSPASPSLDSLQAPANHPL